MASEAESPSKGLGILYFDPNTTTAKLATASLRLAGYTVFNASSKDEAVELCKAHGPSGDGVVAALLLDASADPRKSAAVLQALVALPGSDQLPGILMVSRRQPNPIPGTEGLPKIKRPFSSPALLKVVERTLAEHRGQSEEPAHQTATERETKLQQILEKHLPKAGLPEGSVSKILAELEAAEGIPSPSGDESLEVDLSRVPLSAVLEMLGNSGVTGVLGVEAEDRHGELHIDQGRLRLAHYRGKDEDLKLGRFVVEGGHMRHEELEAYIIGRDPEGRPLGRRLVDGGFLTREGLMEIVLRQAREIACHLLAFKEGKVAFRVSTEPHPLVNYVAGSSKAELQIAEALLDGLRRVEQAATMGPHMPQLDEVFLRLDEQVKKLGREIFDTEELGVLELVNGRNSVKEIARRTRTGTFAVAKILFRLGKAKVVRRAMTPVTV
jgi:CheY-like chemotaxis protein